MREEVVSCFMKKEVDQSISIKTLSRQPPFLFRNNTYQKKFTYGATSNLHPMIPQRCKCSNPTPKKLVSGLCIRYLRLGFIKSMTYIRYIIPESHHIVVCRKRIVRLYALLPGNRGLSAVKWLLTNKNMILLLHFVARITPTKMFGHSPADLYTPSHDD